MNRIFVSLLCIFLCVISLNSHASHIVGGEISYDTVGIDGNGDMVYNLRFELFRDCDAAAAFPGDGIGASPFHFTIFDAANNVIINE